MIWSTTLQLNGQFVGFLADSLQLIPTQWTPARTQLSTIELCLHMSRSTPLILTDWLHKHLIFISI